MPRHSGSKLLVSADSSAWRMPSRPLGPRLLPTTRLLPPAGAAAAWPRVLAAPRTSCSSQARWSVRVDVFRLNPREQAAGERRPYIGQVDDGLAPSALRAGLELLRALDDAAVAHHLARRAGRRRRGAAPARITRSRAGGGRADRARQGDRSPRVSVRTSRRLERTDRRAALG
jgi:hypothetical protein